MQQTRDHGLPTKPFHPADLLPAIEVAYSRFEEIVSLENELEDMQERFETRKRVDRAKGLLQEQMNLASLKLSAGYKRPP